MASIIDFPKKPPPTPPLTITREEWIESILALGRPVAASLGTVALLEECRASAWAQAIAWAEAGGCRWLIDRGNGDDLVDVTAIEGVDAGILDLVAKHAGIVVEIDKYLHDLRSVRRPRSAS